MPATTKVWSFEPFGPLGIPAIANHMFWGGLWGIVFALVWHKIPVNAWWLKGLVFGWLIVVLANWIVIPLIRNQALFAGLDPKRMLTGLLILGGFGMATAVIYGLLRHWA
jgi:hypothetical protein